MLHPVQNSVEKAHTIELTKAATNNSNNSAGLPGTVCGFFTQILLLLADQLMANGGVHKCAVLAVFEMIFSVTNGLLKICLSKLDGHWTIVLVFLLGVKPSFQVRSEVLGFGGAKCSFRGARFLFLL